MNSVINIENVVKTYDMGEISVHALRGVDLMIKKGEFVSITGPSGSGKSTLMHIIGLLDRPTTGKVKLEGKDVSTFSQDERATMRNKHLGFVFQQFNLLRRTSALDNVSLPLLYSGVGPAERNRRAKEALEKVGLGERLDHYSTQLSGGQQQRVAIARALINKPSLILADEPTGNLDSKSGSEIMGLLKSLNDAGNTIVLVTHELDIARGTKRIVEIMDGKIVNDELNGKKH
jgi:putative ABC transport system ATP-binding protein